MDSGKREMILFDIFIPFPPKKKKKKSQFTEIFIEISLIYEEEKKNILEKLAKGWKERAVVRVGMES